MLKIRNAEGILSSELPTGNLLWVDQVNGIDKLAVRGRMTIPFKTLTAAKNAAQPGETIMVLPGTYDETGLAKHGVNWFLHAGATIAATDDESVFDDGGVEASYDVDGLGVIGSSGTDVDLFKVTHSSSRVCISCRELNGSLTAGYSLIRVEAGNVQLQCQQMNAHDDARAISISGGKLVARVQEITSEDAESVSQNGGTLYLNVQKLFADIGAGIRISGGICHADADTLASDTSSVLEITGGTVFCNAQRISGGSALAIYVWGGSVDVSALLIEAADNAVQFGSGICRVFGARMVADRPVYIQGSGCSLNNCWLVATTASIDAPDATTIVCRACAGNLTYGSNVTVVGEDLVIDSNYT